MQRTVATITSSEQPRFGFTLIELVAVMVIVAILAVTAVPAINSIADTRRKAAGNQLLGDLSFARQYAQATGSTTWVVFDTSVHRWSLAVENPDSPGRLDATLLLDPGTGRLFERTLGTAEFVGAAIESVSFDGQPIIGFDWRGRPLNASEEPLAARGTIALSGTIEIHVEAGTGHVMK